MLLYEADFLLGEAAVRLNSTTNSSVTLLTSRNSSLVSSTMESFHPELAPKYARKPIKKANRGMIGLTLSLQLSKFER